LTATVCTLVDSACEYESAAIDEHGVNRSPR
jgi:hypothetical protein